MVVLIIMGMLGESVASVHKVGGSAGWTILGKVDYNKWTSSDTFTTGDSLLFVYNRQFHNVKQVSRRDFLSCNATSAMAATYTSGSDTVALTKPGHLYFLCGFPGHCQAGQKLHVLVATAIVSPTLSPAFAPVPSPSTGSSSSPSPATASKDTAQNDAALLSMSAALTSTLSSVVVFLVALVYY
ncbi:Phytocyanin domain [Arabidopsis thaliana x Arabidopsis arenosa]|uniref:Phytocyanin domain n=1 Tax=Arabidopsis thaliana x Arabidopsis arenosa TaxID=1240361 RepID=A0A8T1XHD9_9BRAS|nr:Phytocyanin domain [Arabidopsis thaliana x Arabidopsis arenosa]